jgi:hypothetical protein
MIPDLSNKEIIGGACGRETCQKRLNKANHFSPPAEGKIQHRTRMIQREHKAPKIVTQIPAQELWAGQRLVSTIRLRNLTIDDITSLLRAGEVRFVVADVGKELRWVPNNERFDFWKNEVKPHLTTREDRKGLDEFPDSYFYIASEWQSYSGETIVLLEKRH